MKIRSKKVTLNLLSNVIDNSNDQTNFPHKLLLSVTQVSRLHKAFHQLTQNYQKLLSKMVQLKENF